jgi:indolepyruvate ferredoxin oxidoreductase
MAAHLEGKGASVLDMAGLAQKGGAVFSHVFLAQQSSDIQNTRVAAGEADLLLCGDLVVGSSPEAVQRLRADHSFTLLNSDVSPTAAFVSNPNWSLAAADLKDVIQTASGAGRLVSIDASNLAVKLLGDAVYANPIMLGFAYQKGWIPLHHQSLQRAIELNGVQIELNLRAFNIGRLAVHDAAALVSASVSTGSDISDPPNALPDNPSLEQLLAHRSSLLMNYQSKAYASRYQGFVKEVAAAEQKACGTETLAQAVASALFKLMAYKDEYEVARLYSDGEFIRKIDAQFEGDWSLRFYLAPPLLAKRDSQGVLLKKSYSAKMMLAFKFLARLKFLRGRPFQSPRGAFKTGSLQSGRINRRRYI